MAHILLAEDDESMRHFLVAALTRAGHEVNAFADGREAAEALGPPIDLLVADIVLPGFGGIELARRASDAQPGLPVLFITGFSATALTDGRPPLPGSAVLNKPFKLTQLVREVRKLLAA